MSKSCLIATLFVVSIVLLSATAGCWDKTPTPTPTGVGRIQLWGNGYWYLLGINYPWLNYAHDFGTTAWGHDGVSSATVESTVEADFAYLQAKGVHVVRWFLFGDGRASPEFDADGNVTGLDDYFYADLDTALGIAQKHQICLILVLCDFHLADKAQLINGVQLGGRSGIISDPAKRQSFLDNALRPLLERYGKNRSIIAWEVMNEPEGAMDIPEGQWVGEPVSAAAMQAFVNSVVDCIHTYSSQYATVGSASRGWLGYWTNCNLDFYEYHYYDKMESQYPLDYQCDSLSLDKPCLVGEFPTGNTQRSMTQYLDTIWKNEYAVALAWSYRAGDESSNFESVASEFTAWSVAHAVDVNIGAQAE